MELGGAVGIVACGTVGAGAWGAAGTGACGAVGTGACGAVGTGSAILERPSILLIVASSNVSTHSVGVLGFFIGWLVVDSVSDSVLD